MRTTVGSSAASPVRYLIAATVVLFLSTPCTLANCDCDTPHCDSQQSSQVPCCCCNHCGSPSDRQRFLGDWWGAVPCLAECGITVDASLTQFYQGVASGAGEQRFRYGSKMDVFLNADTGKLGLWDGGLLTSHVVDWQFGQSVIGDAVGLAPVNTGCYSLSSVNQRTR